MSRKTELGLVALMLLYFVGKAVYFAMSIGENLFPDETTWFGISELFSRSFLPPADSPDSYRFGLITHVPTLYFLLMGKVWHLNVLPLSDLIFLRLVNVGLATATVWCGWRLANLLLAEPAGRLLFLALLTNTLMFTFLAGAVNPDNLTNLLAAAALLHLVGFFRERSPSRLLLFFALLMVGCLTKQTFLPLAAALAAVFLFHERRRLAALPASMQVFLSAGRPGEFATTGLCLLLLGANLWLYGGNLIQYRTLIPQPNQVLPETWAMENRVFARDNIIRLFREGKISVAEAAAMIERIPNESDRYGAYQLLEVAIKDMTEGIQRLSRVQYILPWTEFMLGKTYGVLAHLDLEKKGREILPYQVIFALALLLGCRLPWREHLGGAGGFLLFVYIFFLVVLMQLVNYKTYYGSGFIELALQGRYLFPVIVPAYLLTASALTAGLSLWWQGGAGLAVAGAFAWLEFPWFLANVTTEWFFP